METQAITSGPAPLVPQEAGTVVEQRPTLAARPEDEVGDDPQGEPPPLAGALDATPSRSETGNAIEGRTADEAGTMPAPDTCGAPSPYGDGLVCYLKSGHRNAHRSSEATWT